VRDVAGAGRRDGTVLGAAEAETVVKSGLQKSIRELIPCPCGGRHAIAKPGGRGYDGSYPEERQQRNRYFEWFVTDTVTEYLSSRTHIFVVRQTI